jgi:hypothetical protein
MESLWVNERRVMRGSRGLDIQHLVGDMEASMKIRQNNGAEPGVHGRADLFQHGGCGLNLSGHGTHTYTNKPI